MKSLNFKVPADQKGCYFLGGNAPKADVGVGVRRRIVQIDCEQAGIRGVVPIAPANESVFALSQKKQRII